MNLYNLRHWITYSELDKKELNLNFCQPAVDYLAENPDFIKWKFLYKNPYAIDLIKEHIKTEPDDSYIEYLCENPAAIEILEEYIKTKKELMPTLMEQYNQDMEDYWDENNSDDEWNSQESTPECPEVTLSYLLYYLSSNPKAIPLLRKYPKYINNSLYKNNSQEAIDLLRERNMIRAHYLTQNPYAIDIIKENFETIDFTGLSKNPEAIFMLLANQHLINWQNFSKNTSPFAMVLAKRNLHKLNFRYFSQNPSAIYILEKNKIMIDYFGLSSNPKIFVIHPKAVLLWKLTKKQRNQFAWEYPQTFLKLKRFVNTISEAVYNPSYKYCQRRMIQQFKSLSR